MPRTTRSTLSHAPSDLKLGLRDANGHAHKKAVAKAVTKANKNQLQDGKRRAALGEITNAFSETTSQAKKGLSKMLTKSRGSFSRQMSIRNKKKQDEEQSLKINKNKRTKKEDSPQDEEIGESSFQLSDETNSLPPSQQDLYKEVRETNDQAESSSGESSKSSQNNEDKPYRICSPAKPPMGVEDYDAENKDDPHQVSVYVREIFKYYKSREAQFTCPDYLKIVQPEISPAMRGILVDWLVEVQESFELNHETLYTAVKILDLFLSRVKVKKEELQLVGATACLIASKVDERLPPLLDDFVYVCDDAYTKADIRKMEIKMFGAVGFDLGFPLSYRYLRRYGRVCKVTMPVLTFARFVLEMALMEYSLNVETSESLLATAALVFTFKLMEIEGWQKTLEFYSGYDLEQCKPLVFQLHAMLQKPPHETRRTIRTKYEHEVFHKVAKTPIPNELQW